MTSEAYSDIPIQVGIRVTPTVSQLVVGDLITMSITTRPPWWAFWRKPVTKIKPFKIVTIRSGGGGLWKDVGLLV